MANRIVGRSGRVFTRGGSTRRETAWLFIDVVESTLAGAPTAVLQGSLNGAALALRPFTIIRVRGVLQMRSDQIAARETYGVALGFAVVSDQATAIGVTAVPTPITDRGSDMFFVFEEMLGSAIGDVATGTSQNIGWQKEIDSKAMRKVDIGQDLAITVENEINGVVVTFAGRMLIKLH